MEEVQEKGSHQFPLACIVAAETQQDCNVTAESPAGRCALLSLAEPSSLLGSLTVCTCDL